MIKKRSGAAVSAFLAGIALLGVMIIGALTARSDHQPPTVPLRLPSGSPQLPPVPPGS